MVEVVISYLLIPDPSTWFRNFELEESRALIG
jgi:hypothetical protein